MLWKADRSGPCRGILTDMEVKPVLDRVDGHCADAFARSRILCLRSASRRLDHKPRLSLVACAHINRCQVRPEDIAWWEPPGGHELRLDFGLATDIGVRLLRATSDIAVTAVWTRPGPNEEADSDMCWWAGLRQGAHIVGSSATPSLLVITRWGWRCLPDGTSRTWKRLRPTA